MVYSDVIIIIKFTLETKYMVNRLSLDLRIIRNSKKPTFGIYRKPMYTECYIKSNGYNPK